MMMTTSASMAIPGTMDMRVESRGQREPNPAAPRRAAAAWQDWVFERTTMLFAVLVLAMLVAIIGALTYAALPALEKFGPRFFFSDVWNPVKNEFGALAPIYGTLVTSAIALMI